MNNNYCLWYQKEANDWLEALPIGNGRLGAMLYGGAETEHIILNEDTLWSGYPKENYNQNALEYLPLVRKLIFERKYSEAGQIIDEKMLGEYNESYLYPAKILIDFGKNKVSNYVRKLDLNQSVFSVGYDNGISQIKREAFCSYPDNVMIYHIKSDKKEAINFQLRLESELENRVTVNADTIILKGICPSHVVPNYVHSDNPVIFDDEDKVMRFEVRVNIVNESGDGSFTCGEDSITINDASDCTLYIAVRTSFNGFDKIPGKEGVNESELAQKDINWALLLGRDIIRQRHIEDYQAIYNKMFLDLGDGHLCNTPTDVLMERYREKPNSYLEALLFQYGRYLLISSSREGTQPANLQGIWSNEIRPPWSSNWTTNINAEMNYWGVYSGNLAECALPLIKMVEEIAVRGKEVAKLNYGCKGWVCNHNIDIWRNPMAVGGQARWAYWPMAGLWLCRNVWEHYCFTLDKEYLKKTALPLIEGSVEFALSWLVEDEEGYLVTNPSTSPENAFFTDEKEICAVSYMTAADTQFITDLFSVYKEVCQILKIQSELTESVTKSLSKLKKLQIGKYGQLMEWCEDFEETEIGHRHFSHLYGVYPASMLTKEKTPELFDASFVSLIRRLENGSGHTGWSCGWAINLLARYKESEMVNKYIKKLIGDATAFNLFSLHPPFQIDGNLCYISNLCEVLLQSHNGEIELLLVANKLWKNGMVKGLKARGGYTVDMLWENGELIQAAITSEKAGEVIVNANAPIVPQEKYHCQYIDEKRTRFVFEAGEKVCIIGSNANKTRLNKN